MELFTEFNRIIRHEVDLRKIHFANEQNRIVLKPRYFEGVAWRIYEIAKNSTILRCCAKNGHLTDETIAYESDGAHTNLAMAIADYALDFIYTSKNEKLPYTHREVIEAVRLHDLHENETGDLPDNEDLDRIAKSKQEADYYAKYFRSYPGYGRTFIRNVKNILQEMEMKNTKIGRIIYLSDKIAAIIMALCYDSQMVYPISHPRDKDVSNKGREAMSICDTIILQTIKKEDDTEVNVRHGYLDSELWTIDFFKGRKLTAFDDTGFFTALLVMFTLVTKKRWYSWREKDYIA